VSDDAGLLLFVYGGCTFKVAAGALWSQVKPGSRAVRSQADFYTLRYGKPYFDYFLRGFMHKFDGELPLRETRMPRFAVLRERLRQRNARGYSTSGSGYHPALGTQQIVDAEVKRFVEDGYTTAQKVIRENIDDLHAIAKALLDFETLTGDEITDLLAGKRPVRESVIEPTTPRSSADSSR